jgi:fluoride exporter
VTRERLFLLVSVMAGGFIGSLLRALAFRAFPVGDGAFPSTTLGVNVLGSLVIGWFLARRDRSVEGRWSLHFWAVGALGSFTTFSAFSVEVVDLVHSGSVFVAAAYVMTSMFLGLTAAWFGDRLGAAS